MRLGLTKKGRSFKIWIKESPKSFTNGVLLFNVFTKVIFNEFRERTFTEFKTELFYPEIHFRATE